MSSGNTGVLATALRGVEGTALSQNGIGVAGTANNGATAIGVYGRSDTGYAGRFVGKVRIDGDLQVLGTLSKGGGAFRIDHPLDPADKYLSALVRRVAGHEERLRRRGHAPTASGFATVRLPELLRGAQPRLPLPAHARSAPRARGDRRREIAGNRFVIRTAKPRVKVSWQVTGIRQDRYANAHPIQVEEPKPVAEQGDGLYP